MLLMVLLEFLHQAVLLAEDSPITVYDLQQ